MVGVNFFDKKDEMGRARVEEVRQRAEVQQQPTNCVLYKLAENQACNSKFIIPLKEEF